MNAPVKAAAGILLTEEAEPRVLLAKRNPELRFMGGHHVFPGGRIDEDETTALVTGARDLEDAAAVFAVVREVFEETGLLLVSGSPPTPDQCRTARHAVLEGSLKFDAFLAGHGLTIDAARFEPAGVWVTPRIAPIRFDTRYYLRRVEQAEGHEVIEGEIVALDWLTPGQARNRWRAGELQLPPPVAYVLQNLASYPFPRVWSHLRSSGDHTGDRPAKMEFACGIYLLPLLSPTIPPATHTNCVIVGDRDLYIIDPGTHNVEELALLTRQIGMLLDLGGRVRAILLTHSHGDHVCGVEQVRELYDVPVWAHKAAARQLRFPVDRFLRDGDVIEAAGAPPWRLRCIHTPGHDPGHLCFLEETTRTLIAGDMMANPGTIVVSLDMGGDMTDFLNSLERLMAEDAAIILPGHGMPSMQPRKKLREHLEHRLWREEKVKAALSNGHTTIDALLDCVYDDAPDASRPLAEHTLRAHLARLGVELSP